MPTVIVDLSFLTASGRDDVQCALRDCTVLITFELIYEMMTNSQGVNPRVYLDKLAGLDLVHSRDLVGLVNAEVRTSQRMTDVLHPNSKALLDFVSDGRGVGVVPDVGQEVRDFFEKDEPQRLRDGLDAMWEPKHDKIFKKQRSIDIATDAKNYLELFAPLGAAGIGAVIAEKRKMTQPPAPGWLTYEWERLRHFLTFRFRLNGNRSRHLKDKNLANDLADVTYLCFLPSVDAIATGDTTLIVPLAQAFGAANPKIIQPHHKSR